MKTVKYKRTIIPRKAIPPMIERAMIPPLEISVMSVIVFTDLLYHVSAPMRDKKRTIFNTRKNRPRTETKEKGEKH
jgi:hypothetical protein